MASTTKPEVSPKPEEVDTSTTSTITAVGISRLIPYKSQHLLTTIQHTPSIQQKVFNIFELSEQILLCAATSSPRTVLTAQRVNKDWHHVIQHSTPLQRALWFQPCPVRLQALKMHVRTWEYDPNDPVQFDPVIWPKAPARNAVRADGQLLKQGREGCESWRRMLVAVLDIPTMRIEVYTDDGRIRGVWADEKTTVGVLFERAGKVEVTRTGVGEVMQETGHCGIEPSGW